MLQFWVNIIPGVSIPVTLAFLNLGDLHDIITGDTNYLTKIFIITAKRQSPIKRVDAPTVQNKCEIIKEIHQMENMAFLQRFSLQHILYLSFHV